jgi:hypothetical protein
MFPSTNDYKYLYSFVNDYCMTLMLRISRKLLTSWDTFFTGFGNGDLAIKALREDEIFKAMTF